MGDSWDRLIIAFKDWYRNGRQTVYVYRIGVTGEPEKPYLLKACGEFDSDAELLQYIRDVYGTGEFRILIRDGSTMVYTGNVGVECPRY